MISFFCLSTTFMGIHYFYRNVLGREDLAPTENNPTIEFYLFSFAALTKPDPLPWFPKMSAGNY